MKLTPGELKDVLLGTLSVKDRELTCDELLEVMAQVAEAKTRGIALPPELRSLVEHHLTICPSCTEELEALILALSP